MDTTSLLNRNIADDSYEDLSMILPYSPEDNTSVVHPAAGDSSSVVLQASKVEVVEISSDSDPEDREGEIIEIFDSDGETSVIVRPNSTVDVVGEHRLLKSLEQQDFVRNTTEFECPVCLCPIPAGKGVVLHECLHEVCRECLVLTVKHSTDAEVKCPYMDDNYSCQFFLQHREVRAALADGDLFNRHLSMCLKVAEQRIENSFHCKKPDCKGWCIVEINLGVFRCPVCRSNNCISCRAIHVGVDCNQYKTLKLKEIDAINEAKTLRKIEHNIAQGIAMRCPTCKIVVTKPGGCDWCKCTICGTEICWATRARRWGPGGLGDNSGGCRCRLNGKLCTPKCNNCH